MSIVHDMPGVTRDLISSEVRDDYVLLDTGGIGMEIEMASGKIRDKHVADEEEDYEGVPAWSALYPITQVLGEPSDCARQLPGLTRPDEMADFVPGARLDEVMTKTYRRTFG